MAQQYSRYKNRRQQLLSRLGQLTSSDLILICAAVEPHARFVQNKTFSYFTGLDEPAAMLCIAGNGHETLFVPNYNGVRAQWVAQELVPSQQVATELQVDEVRYQGGVEQGYSFVPFRRDAQYTAFLEHVKQHLGDAGRLFVVGQPGWQTDTYAQQMSWFLGKFMPALHEEKRIVDCLPQVAALRRCKEPYEIECIEQAIAITADAQQRAHEAIVAGARECEVVAALEAEFMKNGCQVPAFPSIVATGRNTTVLHYLGANSVLKDGDMVVVDIGASVDGYAADITRTYCVGGKLSDRQKEIYSLVLAAQGHIASVARPGLWLNNRDKPKESLNHMVRAFYDKHKEGLSQFMPHGLGHFMGLDVHDVGDASIPLAPGDVITIEPGLYLPEEAIGVRIEDDYLITDEGARCLSPHIPKQLAEIEG